jgi:O-antigen/teichoic acid export membrane protein
MISSGGAAVIGVVYWAVAAHMAPTASVGRASAEVAAMLLLANLAQLSYGSLFERFLPVAGHLTRAFVKRAYVTCTILGFFLAIAYLALGLGRQFVSPTLGWRALFVVAVVLWTIFALQDSVLIGLRASRWVAVENIAYALAKLALLPAFILITPSDGIFLAWTAPVVLTIIAVTWYLFNRRIPDHMSSTKSAEELPSTRDLILLAGAQYASLLSAVFMPSLLTLIVIQRLGAVAVAHFVLPTMISGGLGLFSWNIVRSFLVEASHEPEALRHHANSAIRALAVVLLPSVAIGYIFAPNFLRIFGTAYSADGTALMRMLLLSLLGSAVMVFYSSFAWLDKRVWWMTARNLASSLIQLGVVYALIDRQGINAIGIAALVNSVITLVIFLPVSIRRYRMTAVVPESGDSDSSSISDG